MALRELRKQRWLALGLQAWVASLWAWCPMPRSMLSVRGAVRAGILSARPPAYCAARSEGGVGGGLRRKGGFTLGDRHSGHVGMLVRNPKACGALAIAPCMDAALHTRRPSGLNPGCPERNVGKCSNVFESS